MHLGLTSSDVLDTCLAVQLKDAMTLIIKGAKGLQEAVKKQAFLHKNTAMIGRSHGIHGEPITFGFKLAIWYEELGRNIERLKRARLEDRLRADLRSHGDLRKRRPVR